jgi:hypothetical protein
VKPPKYQNKKPSKFYPITPLVKLHMKKLQTPKMTRAKLKTSELQKTKTKNLQSFKKKIKYPIAPL